jgi:hypothetical protein
MTSLDLQLRDDQAARIGRFAQSLHTTPREAAVQLLEEALRHAEYPSIEFRNSPQGRQAYIVGSSLAAWEVLMIAESYDLDPRGTANHLGWSESKLREVLRYAAAFPAELKTAIAENRALDATSLRDSLPLGSWLDTEVDIEIDSSATIPQRPGIPRK